MALFGVLPLQKGELKKKKNTHTHTKNRGFARFFSITLGKKENAAPLALIFRCSGEA